MTTATTTTATRTAAAAITETKRWWIMIMLRHFRISLPLQGACGFIFFKTSLSFVNDTFLKLWNITLNTENVQQTLYTQSARVAQLCCS